MTWRPAANVGDLADRDVIGREVDGRRIAIYRLEDGYFATSDLCTHGRATLSEGEVVEGYIECPLHFGLFEIRTGKAAGAPVSVDLTTYPVRIEGARIEVDTGAEATMASDRKSAAL